MKRLWQCTSALALVLMTSTSAWATPIVVDGSWHEFQFGLADSVSLSCGGFCVGTANPVAEQTSSPSWTFSGPATLTVQDLFQAGDRFEVFDFGVSLGATSIVANTGLSTCGNDIGCAVGSAEYSQGVLNLGAGAHSLTIHVIQNATGTTGGAAVFQVSPSSSVPEPVLVLMLGAGLAATRFRLARRAYR